jgi:hypothetical protein
VRFLEKPVPSLAMLPRLALPVRHHLLAKLVESAQVPVLHLSIATLNANR